MARHAQRDRQGPGASTRINTPASAYARKGAGLAGRVANNRNAGQREAMDKKSSNLLDRKPSVPMGHYFSVNPLTIREAENAIYAEFTIILRHNEALTRETVADAITYTITTDGVIIGKFALLTMTDPKRDRIYLNFWTHRVAYDRMMDQYGPGRVNDAWAENDRVIVERFEFIIERVEDTLRYVSSERAKQIEREKQAAGTSAQRHAPGRHDLTSAEIDQRRAIVAQAEGLKRDTPGLTWKEIAAQVGTRERTLRDWRAKPRYQSAADNAKK